MALVKYNVECPVCGADVTIEDDDDQIYVDGICDQCGYDGNFLVKKDD